MKIWYENENGQLGRVGFIYMIASDNKKVYKLFRRSVANGFFDNKTLFKSTPNQKDFPLSISH